MHEDIRKFIEGHESSIEEARRIDEIAEHLDVSMNPGSIILAYYVCNREDPELFYDNKQTLLFGQIGTCDGEYKIENFVAPQIKIPATKVCEVMYDDLAFGRNFIKSLSQDPKLTQEQRDRARMKYERIKDLPLPLPMETAPGRIHESRDYSIAASHNYIVMIDGEIPEKTIQAYAEFWEKDLKEMVRVKSA